MSVTLQGWQALWRALGAAWADEALFQRLVAGWSEPQRHYHTLQHLRECLAQLEAVRPLAQRPAEIELALWFHDAIYDPTRGDNEQRSADWARASVAEAGLDAGLGDRIHGMVMATCHGAAPTDPDTQLLVDIDLSTLGAPPPRYAQYGLQIRKEYSHVPEAEFGPRRKLILEGFLRRPRVYATRWFHDSLEQQARANMQAEIARL